jgi:hypothetical protein
MQTIRLESPAGIIWALLAESCDPLGPRLYAVYWERNLPSPEMRYLPVVRLPDGEYALRGDAPLPPRPV